MLYAAAAVERAMKIQQVIVRALSGAITWLQVADILGRDPRSMRRDGRLSPVHARQITGSGLTGHALSGPDVADQPQVALQVDLLRPPGPVGAIAGFTKRIAQGRVGP